MSRGRSLELYFVDGQADGMLTAEVFNWTGHVLRIPRTQLAQGLRRPEARQTGVYILLGRDDAGDLAYIGEAEDMAHRLAQHGKAKDWWEQAVLITTAGDALHKAHVKYLESRLVEKARAANVMALENGNQPQRSSLNEAAEANMESFLDTLDMVLPAIRVDLFASGARTPAPDRQTPEGSAETVFEINMPKRHIAARARIDEGKVVLLQGSHIRTAWIGDRSEKSSYWKLHDTLVSEGTIVLQGDYSKTTTDYAFNSPSAAAAIVTGRPSNGRTEWKLADGRTYAQWEADQIEDIAT